MSFKYILYFLLIIASVSCKQEVVHPDDIRQEVDESTDQLQFAIISSNPSASSSATLRVVGIEYSESIKIYNDQYCSNKIADEEAVKSILDITLTFSAEDTYDLYYVYTDSTKTSGSCRPTKMSYQYDATAPTAATFSLNTNSTSNTNAPSLQISSLNSGEIVKVYRDSACSFEILAYTATSSVTLNKYITSLIASEGTYTFYYSIEDLAGNKLTISSSTCHSTSVSYTYDVTKPNPSSSFDFEGTVSTISKKLLRASNISSLSELKIYQDSTCSTMLCNNTDSAAIDNCLVNNQSGDYYDDSSNYFIFDQNAETIKDYYFKYKSTGNESSCLRVNNYLLNNTAENVIPTFTIVEQTIMNLKLLEFTVAAC